jgi:hypothetical protein
MNPFRKHDPLSCQRVTLGGFPKGADGQVWLEHVD